MILALLLAAQEFENDPRFHELFRTAAAAHQKYGRVDDGLRFAPTLCMAPSAKPVRF